MALTPKGIEVERDLTEHQRTLLARAYSEAGAEAVDGFRKVLLGLVTEQDRRALMVRHGQGEESERSHLQPPRPGNSGR